MENYCELGHTFELQKKTWPLRVDLKKIRKIVERERCNLNQDQQKKIQLHAELVTSKLNQVVNECDHARMALSNHKYANIQTHLQTAEITLTNACRELADYKNTIQTILKIDVDTPQARY